MTQPVDIPAHLLHRLRVARCAYAVACAESQAAQFPGIMFTAVVEGQLHSYETDENMEIKARNI